MNKAIKLKSVEEILTRFRELVSRYRRRFIHRNIRPCPQNCKFAYTMGHTIVGCSKCGSRNLEYCKTPTSFNTEYSKQELNTQFDKMLRDPQILLQDYRDLVAFMFVLGYFDTPTPIPEEIIEGKNRG